MACAKFCERPNPDGFRTRDARVNTGGRQGAAVTAPQTNRQGELRRGGCEGLQSCAGAALSLAPADTMARNQYYLNNLIWEKLNEVDVCFL
ncbi:hypothetical protein JZ751_003625 [Albula glossodonta]|uniref:Uncharacterized protein n=1 Tax=Albula glossodonta TaxID=121402 RepID=A0A8T2N681_9TELE|nr:hypothetical protein JZ751_003625 [Albula glossodonta]